MYLPELNWETQVASVIKIDATHYECTVSPTNPNEPGGGTAEIIVGECYLMDYVGHIFEITQVVSGTLTKVIRVLDSFGEDMGPQQGRSAYVYKSVGSGKAPYVSPVNYRRLDASAIDYALPIEKDIIWRHRGLHGVGTGIDEVNLTKITLGAGLKFSDLLSTGWNGGKSVTIGVDDHNNLPGLQGIGPDYYHLMYEQYRGVSAGSGGYLPRYNVAGWLENSKFTDDGTTPKYNTNTIWHSGNDGHNSGMDADTIDGYQASDFATHASVAAAVAALVDSSPQTLDTLNELAAALGDDPNFATTITNSLANKLSKDGGSMNNINRVVNLNADLLHGHSMVDAGNNFGGITYIDNDGVMEVGKYLDFHETDTATNDYDARFQSSGGVPYWNGQQMWHSGNDGHNSGLDADTIDGYQASDLFTKGVYAGDANDFPHLGTEYWTTGTLNKPEQGYGTILNLQAGIDWKHQLEFGMGGDLTFRNNINSRGWSSRKRIWHSENSNLPTADWNALNININGTATIGTLTGSVVANNGILSVVPGGNSAISPTYTVNDWDGFLAAVAMCNDTTGGKVKGGRIQCGYSIINLPTQDYTELDLSNIYITGGVFRVTVEPLRIKSTCNFEYTTFLYDDVTRGSLIVLSAPENGGSVVYFNDCVFSGITPSSQYDNLAHHIYIDSINQKAFALYFNNCRTSTTSPTNYAGLRVITRAVQDLYISVKGLGLPISGLYGISNSPQTITVFGEQPTRYTTFSLDSTVTLYTPFQNSAYAHVSVNKTRITDIIDPLNVYNDATIYNNLTVNGTTNITRPTTTLTFSESGKWGDFSSIVVQGRREGKTNVIFMSFYSANASSGTDRILGRITNYVSPGYDVMVNVNTPSGLSENATGYIDTNGYIILRIGKGGVTYNAQATWITA